MSFLYEVGQTYPTLGDKPVRIVKRHADLKGYETVVGDDGKCRYDRSTHSADAGRVTGTSHYPPCCEDNLVRPAAAVGLTEAKESVGG